MSREHLLVSDVIINVHGRCLQYDCHGDMLVEQRPWHYVGRKKIHDDEIDECSKDTWS